MKLLMRSDVQGVGRKGDIVDVADGFGRNYLVPKGFAVKATAGVSRQAEMMRRSRAIKDANDRASAEEIAKVLVPSVITIARRAGREGRLFGSVTAADVAQAVADQKHIELDRHDLRLDEPIKAIGQHYVDARLHPEVQFQISVEVVAE